MSLFFVFFLVAFFLFSTFCFKVITSVFHHNPKNLVRDCFLESKLGYYFFYKKIHHYFFPNDFLKTLFFSCICGQNLARLFLAFSFIYSLFQLEIFPFSIINLYSVLLVFLSLIVIIFLSIFLGDFFPRWCGTYHARSALKVVAIPVSFFLCILLPIVVPLVFLINHFVFYSKIKKNSQASDVRERILEIFEDEDSEELMPPEGRELIKSVITFQDRIVREVMIPRVDVFCLSITMTIREAIKLLIEEGYSRIPVYRENIDNIVGILMHRDLLEVLLNSQKEGENSSILDVTIGSLIKNIFFVPEIKKISLLLQEFRQEQMHLAVVVDEYGGTAGIITIEDVLEELVGDIEDEYDEEKEQFIKLPKGGWIIDARMSILDIEDELGLKIPQTADYDTIGGYIFHRAGSIPTKGFIIQHDDFELEVTASNDRCIEKVKIIPNTKSK